LVVVAFGIGKFYFTGKVVETTIQIIPLDSQEKAVVENVVIQNPILADLPNKGLISIRFFKLENGQRVWQEGFLISNKGIEKSGEPDIYLYLHSKYLLEITEDNLCEIVRGANRNGDLGFDTNKNKALLLLKYGKMLKYKSCL